MHGGYTLRAKNKEGESCCNTSRLLKYAMKDKYNKQ